MSKKKYFDGLTALTNNLEKNVAENAQDFSANPNIILSDADLYTTNYNYSLISDEITKNNLFKYEFIIVNSLKSIAKNYKDICEKLYLAQTLLANYDNSQGMFYAWFNSLKLDKNFVYRCLDRYQVFLETNKDIYLSQDVSVRTIQLIKKIDDIAIKIEVADKIQHKEFLSAKSIHNYLVSRVRQDSQEIQTKSIANSHIKLVQTAKQVSIKLKGSFSDTEIAKIYELLDGFITMRENKK